MAWSKVRNSYSAETGRSLSGNSYLNMFEILKDLSTGTELFNIWKSYKILHTEDLLCYFDLYTVKENDWFENISYEVYGTVDYWWIIPMFNKIENPFEALVPGENLYILRKEYIRIVLADMKNIREL